MASIFKQKYTVAGKNGKRIRKQSQYWYVDYKTSDGTRDRVKGFKDKSTTTQLAAELEKKAELARAGIVDKYAEYRKTPLKKHLDDYRQNMVDGGDTPKHAKTTYNRSKAIIEGCGFAFIIDVSASAVQNHLAERRRLGLGVSTSNHYLQAIKGFLNWMVADGRTDENPLSHIKRLNANTDKRHERRALTIEELCHLIETTIKGPKHHKMTGEERALLYVLAASTGFRASELSSLTWLSFDFGNDGPTVTVLAAYSKRKRDDIQLLPRYIADQFVLWRQELGASLDSRVFPRFDESKGAEILRVDLEAAGIPYRDKSDRVVDFHALRHTYISNLNQSGASPKVSQSLARHSTITLTLDRYTHLAMHSERKAVENLPAVPNVYGNHTRDNKTVALKTGTDDLPTDIDRSAYKKLTKKPYSECNSLSSPGSGEGQICDENETAAVASKTLSTPGLGTDTDQLSLGDTVQNKNTLGKTQKYQRRIQWPMLKTAHRVKNLFLTCCNTYFDNQSLKRGDFSKNMDRKRGFIRLMALVPH
jgi:integrase